jgi:hypothetical protein
MIESHRAAAVLCPGPSLPRTWRTGTDERYDLVFAVNFALNHAAADYLVCGDHGLFSDLGVERADGSRIRLSRRPHLGVIVPRNVWHDITTGHDAQYWNEGHVWDPSPWRPLPAIYWDDLHLADNSTPCNFSSVAVIAAILQVFTGIHRIDVYGADMTESAGSDGAIAGRHRQRWRDEARDLREVLARRPSVIVNRILPHPPEIPDEPQAVPPVTATAAHAAAGGHASDV